MERSIFMRFFWVVPILAATACAKPNVNYDPFPDTLECLFTYPEGVGASYIIDFATTDVILGGGYVPVSLKQDRGWKIDLGLLDQSAGVARFDVDPRGRLNGGETAPQSFTVRVDNAGEFVLVVDHGDDANPFPKSEIRCLALTESENADP